MKLSQKRALFSKLFAELIIWAHENGMYVAIDQVKRTQAEANANAKSGAGIANSNHLVGLAGDLILYEGPGYEYKTKTSDYQRLGNKWKSMHQLCCWGGDFTTRSDGNHFSLEHNGVK